MVKRASGRIDFATQSSAALEEQVRLTAKSGSIDRYLAALLAPRAVRSDLIALAAYAAEINKIVAQSSEPHLGEIRLQWWRDALSEANAGVQSGHPVTDAFSAAIVRHAIPRASLGDHLDASVHALYGEPPENDAQLRLALEMTEGVLFRCAARILGMSEAPTFDRIVNEAAFAWGLTQVALGLPQAVARGSLRVPAEWESVDDPSQARRLIARISGEARQHLHQVRAAYSGLPRPLATALLPLALVEPYLEALTRASHDPMRDIADIAPMTRVWRLAKAHYRGRV